MYSIFRYFIMQDALIVSNHIYHDKILTYLAKM